LPQRLRTIKFGSGPALFIPGGPERYLKILAQQAESRIRLLQATTKPATSDKQAAKNIAEGIAALVSWWNVHHYVKDGNVDEPFNLSFVHSSQVSILHNWCLTNVKNPVVVSKLVTQILSNKHTLPEPQAIKIMEELISK
jgi:hypothetical protein